MAGVQEVAVGRLLQAQSQVYQAAHHHLDLCKATRRSSARAGPGHRRQPLLRAGCPAPGTVWLWKQDGEQAEHQGSEVPSLARQGLKCLQVKVVFPKTQWTIYVGPGQASITLCIRKEESWFSSHPSTASGNEPQISRWHGHLF